MSRHFRNRILTHGLWRNKILSIAVNLSSKTEEVLLLTWRIRKPFLICLWDINKFLSKQLDYEEEGNQTSSTEEHLLPRYRVITKNVMKQFFSNSQSH